MVLIQVKLSDKANYFLVNYKAKNSLNDKRIALNLLLEELNDKEIK